LQVFKIVIRLVMVKMDNVLVFVGWLLAEEPGYFPVNVQRTVIAGTMQVKGFVAGSNGALQQFTVLQHIVFVTGYSAM
jgi:hypothetical protein